MIVLGVKETKGTEVFMKEPDVILKLLKGQDE